MVISIVRTLSIAGQALAKRQLLSSYLMLRVKLGFSLCTAPSNRVKISSLDRKLLRDFAKTKGQSLAACLVMACGLAMMIMTRSLVLSLESARADYYDVVDLPRSFVTLNALRTRCEKGSRRFPAWRLFRRR